MTAGEQPNPDKLKGAIDAHKDIIKEKAKDNLGLADDAMNVFFGEIDELMADVNGLADPAKQEELYQEIVTFLEGLDDADIRELATSTTTELSDLANVITAGVLGGASAPVAPASGPSATADGGKTPELPTGIPDEHTVGSGDTLSKLVIKYFKVDWNIQPQLAFAIVKRINEARGGDKDPNILQSGEVLELKPVKDNWSTICGDVAGSLDWYGGVSTTTTGWKAGLRERATREVVADYCEDAPVGDTLTDLYDAIDKKVITPKADVALDSDMTRDDVDLADGWEWVNPSSEIGADNYWHVKKVTQVVPVAPAVAPGAEPADGSATAPEESLADGTEDVAPTYEGLKEVDNKYVVKKVKDFIKIGKNPEPAHKDGPFIMEGSWIVFAELGGLDDKIRNDSDTDYIDILRTALNAEWTRQMKIKDTATLAKQTGERPKFVTDTVAKFWDKEADGDAPFYVGVSGDEVSSEYTIFFSENWAVDDPVIGQDLASRLYGTNSTEDLEKLKDSLNAEWQRRFAEAEEEEPTSSISK